MNPAVLKQQFKPAISRL